MESTPSANCSRYAISVTPALYLLACQGVHVMASSFSRPGARGTAYTAASVLVVALTAGNVLSYYGKINKPQWREAAEYIEAEAEPGDLVVVAPGYQAEYALRHYLDDRKVRILPYGPRNLRAFATREGLTKTAQEANGRDRLWLVVSTGASADEVRELLLNEPFASTDERVYKQVQVELFQKHPPG